jgi:uncharacterized protein YbcV (DUF1398 family)
MFTLEQIKAAHSKVKSGADFPAYIAAIKALGVTDYETFVSDGHTVFHGADSFNTTAPAKYASLQIAEISASEQFKKDRVAHQQGKTDFLGFCNDCAKSGIEKWSVVMDEMTCSYSDKAGKVILVEKIPTANSIA